MFVDRSWARRARGGSGRKRPDLLSADFSGDRERPNSPSPLAENKPLLPAATEEEPETKPKYDIPQFCKALYIYNFHHIGQQESPECGSLTCYVKFLSLILPIQFLLSILFFQP